ncbi:MAG: pyridoxamine 5'-phosphate oxidase family protein [Ignavibacteria bacterium]|nr:pyridoxamine 5'-phosphate oxidase family protein [Ignavibacteria bacterium]
MGEIKNYSGSGAIEKLKDLTEGKFCMFCTYSGENMETRPMTTLGIDEDGCLYFFVKGNSTLVSQSEKNSKVDLLYAVGNGDSFTAIKGKAERSSDKTLVEKYWTPFAGAYFENENDPTLVLIKVEPGDVHYWEAKDGKIISMAKILITAVTGEKTDEGRQGDIEVK